MNGLRRRRVACSGGGALAFLVALLVLPAVDVRGQRDTARTLDLTSAEIGAALARSVVSGPGGDWYVLRDDVVGVLKADGSFTPIELADPVAGVSGAPDGLVYLFDRKRRVHVLKGDRITQTFRVAMQPTSIAVTSDGGFIVAAPYDDRLLHQYSNRGHFVRSFGEQVVRSTSRARNAMLNRGLVVVGPGDVSHFVTANSDTPVVMQFDAVGTLLRSYSPAGAALDLQIAATRRLWAANADSSHGLAIITAAAVDPSSGDLWLAANGSSETPLVYVYDSLGMKKAEFEVTVGGVARSAVSGIALRPDSVALVSAGEVVLGQRSTLFGDVVARVRRLVFPGWEAPGRLLPPHTLLANAACAIEQPWNDCKSNCPQVGAPAVILDCKEILQGAVMNYSYRVVGSACTASEQGCAASVTWCNLENGVTQTHTTPGGGGINPCPDRCESGNCPSGYTHNCVGDQAPDPSNCNCCVNYSPILLSLRGPLRMTSAQEGVLFDINGFGSVMWVGWPEGGNAAFVAYDRNGNGQIDDGSELFGNTTPLADGSFPEHGYRALAEFDANGDGWVDAQDVRYGELLLWRDVDHNGVSGPGELAGLLSHGVLRLSVEPKESRRRDRWGNEFRYRARVVSQFPTTSPFSWDVFPVTAPTGDGLTCAPR